MRGDVVGAAKYRKLKKLGSGSFGTVFLVEDASRARFVLKEVDLRGLPLKEQRATMNEVKVLQRLRHKQLFWTDLQVVPGLVTKKGTALYRQENRETAQCQKRWRVIAHRKPCALIGVPFRACHHILSG